MKGQEDLLKWISQRWDEHEQVFRFGDQELAIDRDDIYFFDKIFVPWGIRKPHRWYARSTIYFRVGATLLHP